MALSTTKLAQVARIAVVGQVTAKSSYYDLIGAIRRLDGRLPKTAPILLHLEDFIAAGSQLGGEFELSQTLRWLKSRRDLWVHVVDACIGSGPLTVLLSGTHRSATAPSLVGGFGSFEVLRDSSKQAETEGRKITIVRAGQFKGVGTPGTVVSDEQLAELQSHVDDAANLIFDELTQLKIWNAQQAREIRTGKLFSGTDLKRLNLVDRIASTDEIFSQFVLAMENVK